MLTEAERAEMRARLHPDSVVENPLDSEVAFLESARVLAPSGSRAREPRLSEADSWRWGDWRR